MKITISGVDNIKKHFMAYTKSLAAKLKDFINRLGEIGYKEAVTLYTNALYAGTNDVQVDLPYWKDNHTLILSATGSSITFIEFGTGVWKYGGDIHPLAEEFGFERGEFGYGLGKLHSWRYDGEAGNLGVPITEGKHKGMIRTEGNPPAKAMYIASKTMQEEIITIAKEVFNGK